jgi:hypothetical protein
MLSILTMLSFQFNVVKLILVQNASSSIHKEGVPHKLRIIAPEQMLHWNTLSASVYTWESLLNDLK